MSLVSIRAALETALDGMAPALATAWENVAFTPTVGTPYQRVHLISAAPINDETGSRHIEQGFLQITLCYPIGAGPAEAETRFELIRSTFYRGAAFTSGSVTVRIDKTPAKMPAYVEGDRYCVPVRAPFFAPIEG